MKVIRKYDVFKELTKYADGDLSLGECVDNCSSFNLTDLINELTEIRDHLNDILESEKRGLHMAKDRLGFRINELEKLIEELRGWEND